MGAPEYERAIHNTGRVVSQAFEWLDDRNERI